MYPNKPHRKQTGAGLPVAIFIITVLSLIVLGMSQLQESSGNAISLQIQSQRAFFAAESGAQVIIASLLREAVDDTPLECSSNEAVFDFNVSGLAGCSALVSCGATTSSQVITITSEGSCGVEGSTDHAQREVEVMLHAG